MAHMAMIAFGASILLASQIEAQSPIPQMPADSVWR
jgi:hypothetical protein